MKFSKLFQRVALGLLSSLVVRIINFIFLWYFPFPSNFFMTLASSFFEIFKTLQQRNSVMGSIFYGVERSHEVRHFLRNFLEFPKHVAVEQLWTSASKLFNIFFSKLFNCSFFLFEAIYCLLVLCEKLILILKYYVKYVNFTKKYLLTISSLWN